MYGKMIKTAIFIICNQNSIEYFQTNMNTYISLNNSSISVRGQILW